MNDYLSFSDHDIHSLASQFNAQTLSAAEWTHEAHLAIGLWHLHNYDFNDALCRMRAGIILLNKVHGTPNTQDRGYHETMTWFWLTVLNLWKTNHSHFSLSEQYHALLRSEVSARTFPGIFYLESELKDFATRAVTLKPTLKELKWETISNLIGTVV